MSSRCHTYIPIYCGCSFPRPLITADLLDKWFGPQAFTHEVVGSTPDSATHEQALVCLSNREIVDASRGRIFHCKMANNRLITVFFSNCVGLFYVTI